jgi:D-alanyl-D-alanine carboxypeptidase/D-alanyl-D-alanine-endopeptidase (penicillin-binding protein 4)
MPRTRATIVVLLAIALATPALAKPRRPAAEIEKLLEQSDARRAFWGVEVYSLKSGKVLYSHHPNKLFTPASLTKLFTTAGVLALVGPDYNFRTTVETTGNLDRYGRLTGDLALVGRGDPNLSGRSLPYNLRTERKGSPSQVIDQLADELVAKGLKYVDGDLVADDSYYPLERYGEGWSQEDLVSQWGAPVSALTINDNLMFVSVRPGDRSGERAFVTLDPFAETYQVDNRIITTPAGTGPRSITINRQPGSTRLSLWGTIPLDDPGATEALAIDDPAEFAAQLFRQALERRGVVIFGRNRVRHTDLSSLQTVRVTSIANPGGGSSTSRANQPLVLATHLSQPVIQDIRVINKVSQNLHAELMLRLLGREKGTSGTIEGGLEVLRGFLVQAGIDPGEFDFHDGSGLSRMNLVSPHAIVQLLSYANGQPWGTEYRQTLPVAGEDGTLADRFENTPAQGHVFGKTGSLTHVTNLAGYVTTAGGDDLAFAILCNNGTMQSKRVMEIMDRIVELFVNDAKLEKRKK